MKAQLAALDYQYELDDDNDFKLVFEVGEEGRYTIACPAGWAPRSAIEEYSMGLGGG